MFPLETELNRSLKAFALIALLGVFATGALAQKRPAPPERTGKSEVGLLGIKLFDSGSKVIAKYGNPDDIQPLAMGGGGGGMAGPMAGRGGAPAGPAMGGGAPRPPTFGGPSAAGGTGKRGPLPGARGVTGVQQFIPEMIGDPFGMGQMYQYGPGGPYGGAYGPRPGQGNMSGPIGGPGGGIGYTGSPGGMPGYGGAAGGFRGDDMGGAGLGGPAGGAGAFGAGGFPGGAGSAIGGGAAQTVTYTRWIYRRPTSRYGFVLDKFNRVVQIEAIGLSDPRARTSRGVGFGSTIADVIRKYQDPDEYQISGQNFSMMYLSRERVAFRLSRVVANKPHRVTGIVVAAGA